MDGSVRRKGSTEEKKISKFSEAKRRTLGLMGLRERETSIAVGVRRAELGSP